MSTIVLKVGSSVLRSVEDLPVAVHEVYRWYREGHRVVVVASALAGETEALLSQSRAWSGDGLGQDAVASLVGTGETRSAALLALALERAGVPCESLDPVRLGLTTTSGLEAVPVQLDASRWPTDQRVVVVPGFVGRDAADRPTLLGRGGSDLTAVFLAVALRARCRLLKDVGGVYDLARAQRFRTLSWDDAIALGAKVVQPTALRLARAHRLVVEVGAPAADDVTCIGLETAPAPAGIRRKPLRVVLLGLGTVGGGVYHELGRYPDRFEVVRVLTRRARPGLPRGVGTTDPEVAARTACDVVVDVLGGLEPAGRLIRGALAAGRAVVSANKAVLAADPALLDAAHMRFAGAVGGSVPVLEAVARHAGALVAVEGALNGTATHVLDRLDRGESLPDAVRSAREAGLAEADPTRDLDGRDAADKLALIARVAFGLRLDPSSIQREVVDGTRRQVRQVARVDRSGVARVVLAPAEGPYEGLRGAANVAVLHLEGGATEVLTGRGAGRWPTTTAVLADLLELSREPGRPRRVPGGDGAVAREVGHA